MGQMGRVWVALLLLVGRAPEASAGGFEFPDNGTKAVGRGGAFTVRADDLMALRDIGNLLCDIGPRELSDLTSVQVDSSALEFHQADQTLDEGGLAGAVRPEDAETLLFF